MSETSPSPVEKYNEGIKQKFPVGSYVLRIYPIDDKPLILGKKKGRINRYYYKSHDDNQLGSFTDNGEEIIGLVVTDIIHKRRSQKKADANLLPGSEVWPLKFSKRI